MTWHRLVQAVLVDSTTLNIDRSKLDLEDINPQAPTLANGYSPEHIRLNYEYAIRHNDLNLAMTSSAYFMNMKRLRAAFLALYPTYNYIGLITTIGRIIQWAPFSHVLPTIKYLDKIGMFGDDPNWWNIIYDHALKCSHADDPGFGLPYRASHLPLMNYCVEVKNSNEWKTIGTTKFVCTCGQLITMVVHDRDTEEPDEFDSPLTFIKSINRPWIHLECNHTIDDIVNP